MDSGLLCALLQVIHNLSMWSKDDKNMSYDKVKREANAAKKDMKLVSFALNADIQLTLDSSSISPSRSDNLPGN